MLRLSKKKAIAVAAAGVIVASGAGVAFAYWTATGTGSGSGTTASSNGTLTLHATFDSAVLTPGRSVPVSYTADNGGTSSLFLTALKVDSIQTSDGNCLPADFSATATATGPGTRVPAGSTGTSVGSGTLSMADTSANQDACKGATVTINVSST